MRLVVHTETERNDDGKKREDIENRRVEGREAAQESEVDQSREVRCRFGIDAGTGQEQGSEEVESSRLRFPTSRQRFARWPELRSPLRRVPLSVRPAVPE